jgi:hypothetical protein
VNLKHLVSWEDVSTGIVYTEPYEDSAPLLDVASRFEKQKKAEHPSLSINVKTVTVLPSASSQ